MQKNPKSAMDLQDSEDDRKHLLREETTLDLPDVRDIPGQENIKVPVFGEYVDTTASSADEEGEGLFDDMDEEDDSSNVDNTEKALLKKSANETAGDESEMDVEESALDRTDSEGDLINEGNLLTDRFGEDLDLPESEEVDEEE